MDAPPQDLKAIFPEDLCNWIFSSVVIKMILKIISVLIRGMIK